MRLDRLRLATKLWASVGVMVLLIVIIVGHSTFKSREARGAFGLANTAMAARVTAANQWAALADLNAVRSLAVVVSSDPGITAAFKDPIIATNLQIDELQKSLESMGLSDADTAQITKIGNLRKIVLDISGQSTLVKVLKPAEFPALIESQYRPAVATVQKGFRDFVALQNTSNEKLRANFETSAQQLEMASGLALAAVICGLLVGAAFLIRSIKRPLSEANKLAARITEGDLSAEVDESLADEFGDLMRSLAGMKRSLSRMVSEVRGSTESIANASAEIAKGNNDLAQRTEETSSNLQSTASSMNSLTHTVQNSATNAHQASILAASASSVAQRGGEAVRQVITTMQEIDASSKKISDIIGVIDGIAFQTNILALNAAVEAARAGEQGRGFAVVASEVRSLAQRSAEAAKEIKMLISTSVSKVQSGTQLVTDAGATMDEIVKSVRRVADVISEITTSANEQSAGIAEVNQSIGDLDQMTQQNAALVEQSAAAAESLSEQADRMKQAVAVFKIADVDA